MDFGQAVLRSDPGELGTRRNLVMSYKTHEDYKPHKIIGPYSIYNPSTILLTDAWIDIV